VASSRLSDVLLYAAAAVVLVASAVVDYFYLGMTLQRIYTPLMPIHADFDTFWRSSRAFLEGGDVYRTGAELVNLNPPLWVLLVAPFALLDPLAGFRLFAALTAVVMAASLLWMAAELRPWRTNPLVGSLVLVALLVSSPLLATLALGQMYPILCLGLVAAWVLDRRGRPLASGVALGLVVALKPSLAPVLLWPVVRRRWGASVAAILSGGAATLVGVILLGPGATLQWIELLGDEPLSPYWDNASLPSSAARLFTEHEFGRPLAELPWTVPLFGLLGLALVFLTAYVARRDPEAGLWALTAASLLASPIAWNNYLLLLAPGVLLLLSRGRTAVAVLLVALQLLPPQWPLLWQEGAPLGAAVGPVVAALALTSYLYVLLAHWLAFLTHDGPTEAHTSSKPRAAFETARG
jgi:alpha-1,2-mannosyltransferase